MTPVEVVRRAFEAYLAQDAGTMRSLLGEGYTFTSPQDDHIDAERFMEVCFPTADRVESQEIVELVEAEAGVFIMYEYVLRTGERHRNVEYARVVDGKLVGTEVFFGGAV